MPRPLCEWCSLPAQYDFVADTGEWKYGCTAHWMKFRASKQLGVGHALHIAAGMEPPKRPEGYVPPKVDPNKFVKPQLKPPVDYGPAGFKATPVSADSFIRTPPPPREPKGPRKTVQVVDMPPGPTLGKMLPGSSMTKALDIIAAKIQEGLFGATIEEIQEVIGKQHNATRLLHFMNFSKGVGFKVDPETKRIMVVLP